MFNTVETLKNEKIKICKSANLPLRFTNANLEEFKKVLQGEVDKKEQTDILNFVEQWFNNLKYYLDNGIGLFISGPSGVGKTYLITLIAFEIIKLFNNSNSKIFDARLSTDKNNKTIYENINTLYFVTVQDLLDYHSRYNLNDNELRLRNAFKNFNVLIIDDVTKIYEFKNAL
jgi:DNA replication protein DnaC